MSIPVFIPSYNRAPQLRLLLESLNRNAHGIFQPYVLWKATGLYGYGYRKLMDEDLTKQMGVEWHPEKDFVDDFYKFLSGCGQYMSLFMDDCIYFRRSEFGESDIFNCLNNNTWCVSLRLGDNTVVQNYLSGQEQPKIVPRMVDQIQNPKFVWWNFRDYEYCVNYGFHFSWDGVVYRTQDLLSLFDGTRFDKTDNQHAIVPQRIENYMMNRRAKVPYSLMCAPMESHVVCMNWNSTHPMAVHGTKFGSTMENLETLYAKGYVIDFDSINFSEIKSCHEELSFTCREL